MADLKELAAAGFNQIESKAIMMLGDGVEQSRVAMALGVSPGRISQMMSEEKFSQAVAEIRFKKTKKLAELDDGYDDMEIELQKKLKKSLPMLIRPTDIMKALELTNRAKRRSGDLNPALIDSAQIVKLNMPNWVINNFTMPATTLIESTDRNQIIRVGDQELITVQPGVLAQKVEGKNVQIAHARTVSTEGQIRHPGQEVRASDLD